MSAPAIVALFLLAAPAPEGGVTAAAAVPPPSGPEASPSARPAHRGVGEVAYVTAERAYLDAGSDDGLASGAEVTLRRHGEPSGSCRIEAIAPHHAVCVGARARPGDTFALPAPPAEPPPPTVLPPPPPEDVMARRRAVLESAPLALVTFQAPPKEEPLAMPRTRAIDLSVTHQTWDASPGGASSKESLDLLARGVPLTSWLFLDLDARLEHWTSRQNPRFRPSDKTQVYLWQAQLTALPSDAMSISAGRVLPWGIPGATVFDGGMVGWHSRWGEARVETGVFGGVVPQPDTLKPTTQRDTGGGYWIIDRQLPGGLFRTEGRLAAVRSPELGTRGEASLTGRYFARALDLSAEANLGAGGKVHSGVLDSARVDATFRPASRLTVGGSYRYDGLGWPQTFDPPAFPGKTREADGFLGYEVVRWLRLGATAGFSDDVSSGAGRRFFGPELIMPAVLGRWGTLSAGYLEEKGWIAGRSAYGQWVATPWRPLWFLARASWSHEETQGPYEDEGSVTLAARAELTSFLALRLSLSARTVLDASSGAGSRPAAYSGFATLQAAY